MMMHFGTGILLYLAVGALAAPANPAPKPAPNNNNNDAPAEPSPSKVEEAPKADATSAGGEIAIEESSAASPPPKMEDVLKADAASAGATSAVSSLSVLPSSEEDATGITPTSAAASTAVSSTTPTVTGGVDLKGLFGNDERPDIRHLEAVRAGCDEAKADCDVKGAQFSVTQISTVLLALTKLQSEGNWIKSLFDLPGQKGSVIEGPDIVNVTLANLETMTRGVAKITGKRSIRIEKGNLGILKELGVGSQQITEPWWPWALIEAALQVHSSLDNPSFWEASEMFMLMKIFSGDNEVRDKPKPSDQEVSDIIKNADFSPVIYQEGRKPWAVVMRAPYKNAEDKDEIGWAKPFATTEHDHVGEFNSYNLTSELVFDEIIYFDTPEPFNGRPDILTL